MASTFKRENCKAMMKHQIIYKNKGRYASFPLLKKLDDRILIGFFTAPIPDHMGLFWWNVWESFDQGETWHVTKRYESHCEWDWPANSARERSDMFACEEGCVKIATGSYGFKIWEDHKTKKEEIIKSTSLFHKFSPPDNCELTLWQRFYEIPSIDIILTFPRALEINSFEYGNLILIPAYALLSESNISRCLVWRSENRGKTFRLWNMFPDGVDGNEMAFINTKKGILAHIRSDKHPYLMESWSEDKGRTWTYPTNVYNHQERKNIIGGPPHLLRLQDQRILCSYGYRRQPMGIRAIVSEDEGETWLIPIILREDGGYSSSLHKRKLKNKFKLPGAGNDIGYPISIQLSDKNILTAYYLTTNDRITHIATTKWKV